MTELKGLSPVVTTSRQTETAQRFLAGAYDSVAGVLQAFDTVRAARKAAGYELRGRMTHQEEDLLRSAIIFAGAGLDASLKRLIRDALPTLLDINEGAHDKFQKFVVGHIGSTGSVDAERVACYMVKASPRDALIDAYIFDLTGSSLQSAQEVDRTAAALGINDQQLRKRIAGMREIFVARNEISHELDLKKVENQGDRSRRPRSVAGCLRIAHEALEVAQLIINVVPESVPQ